MLIFALSSLFLSRVVVTPILPHASFQGSCREG